MMAFFSGFNFVRATILFSLIGSGVLGYMAMERADELEQLRSGLEKGGQVETIAAEIQQICREYSQLKRDEQNEGIRGQMNPRSYIQKIAAYEAVELGHIDINSREAPGPRKGITDRTYTIEPNNSDRSFLRSRLANFFYSLEADSRRIRVTRLHVETFSKTKPEEIPEDRWKFDVKVISRSKDD